jgi:GTPase SAR1 family protein
MVSVAPPPAGTTVIIVGRKGVGKTALIRRLHGKAFTDTGPLTPGLVTVGESQAKANVFEASGTVRGDFLPSRSIN